MPARSVQTGDPQHGAPGRDGRAWQIDPDFRVGYAHNWQVLAQRDLPASLTITATYLGTHGSHLMQEFLPNTVPTAASAAVGFVYLTSNGHSHKHTGQLQLRRRLRNGFTGSVQLSVQVPPSFYAYADLYPTFITVPAAVSPILPPATTALVASRLPSMVRLPRISPLTAIRPPFKPP